MTRLLIVITLLLLAGLATLGYSFETAFRYLYLAAAAENRELRTRIAEAESQLVEFNTYATENIRLRESARITDLALRESRQENDRLRQYETTAKEYERLQRT